MTEKLFFNGTLRINPTLPYPTLPPHHPIPPHNTHPTPPTIPLPTLPYLSYSRGVFSIYIGWAILFFFSGGGSKFLISIFCWVNFLGKSDYGGLEIFVDNFGGLTSDFDNFWGLFFKNKLQKFMFSVEMYHTTRHYCH